MSLLEAAKIPPTPAAGGAGSNRRSRLVSARCSAGRRRLVWLPLVALALATTGCGPKLPTRAQVTGKVMYHGKPLEFGTLMFQPDRGWPARGTIQPDGTFQMSTYGDNDGALVAHHRVRIMCYEKQRPGTVVDVDVPEEGLGKSLIPPKYANVDTSGLTVDVKPTNEPIVFELTD